MAKVKPSSKEKIDTQLIGEQFTVIGELGEGGQGIVYKVKSSLDKKDYALKFLKNTHSKTSIERFKREINSLKEIESPFVIRIVSENISNKRKESNKLYYAMELAKFGNLYSNNYYVGDLSLCLELFGKICQGVKAIHDKGIIHRDLKPSNILLVEKQRIPKVSDFGLAYELNATDDEITEIREKVGANYFAAPEQTSLPPEPTKKSDIFSLGKILYFMITGYKSKNLQESLSIKDFVSHNSADKVNDLINKMCAYQPKDRIESVNKILEVIDDLLGSTKDRTEFSPTILQFRILKFIRSFEYESVDFDKIFDHISSFYMVDTLGGSMPAMFSSKMSRLEFADGLENSLETLEKNNIIEFKNGKYKYLKNTKNENLFKKYF